MKKALITGITGQDGYLLTKFLLNKNYEVHGIVRRSSTISNRIKELEKKENVYLHYGDITDSLNIINILELVKPDEIYNLAGQSDVKVSFDTPLYTANVNGLGILNILEGVRILHLEGTCKIYHASTSELFGETDTAPQDENTLFNPCSPYACAKLYAHNMCEVYKNSYNLFICCGILFNHESEIRGEEFVTRKITLAASKISMGLQDKLYLGNINSKRDWGYAKDYVEAMWKMLQQKEPDNYVIATNTQYTIKDFCILAFKEVGIDLEFIGEGINEKGIDYKTKKVLIEINPKYFRPLDVTNLQGNPKKAIKKLEFNPNKTTLESLVKIMISNDLKEIKDEQK